MGLGLKSWEGGKTETAVAVAITDEILRTSAMSARRSLSPYRSTLSLSRSILKLGLFFSFSFLVLEKVPKRERDSRGGSVRAMRGRQVTSYKRKRERMTSPRDDRWCCNSIATPTLQTFKCRILFFLILFSIPISSSPLSFPFLSFSPDSSALFSISQSLLFSPDSRFN